MDTTPRPSPDLDRVTALLESVTDIDPADAVEPLAEAADILESLLDGEDEL